MLKRLLVICMLALATASVSSCLFDPDEKPPVDKPPVAEYEDLTARWHVLNNVEVAYNKRNINRYDQLLDVDYFTFFLSPGDVGGEVPAQWGREEEILYNSRLLDANYSGDNRCKSVTMDLLLPDNKDQISWVGLEPDNAPGETWYTTTVFYSFRFDVEPDTQYESVSGAKAQFTVRNVGTETVPQWRLVEFRDLAED